MKAQDISEAKDLDLRGSMAALQRASLQARKTAIQTGTHLIIVKDGQILRISAEELRQQTEIMEAPASSANPASTSLMRPCAVSAARRNRTRSAP